VVHAPLMQSDVSVCLLLLDWASNFWSRTGTANPRTVTVDTIISIAIKLPENFSIGYTLKEYEANNVIKFLNVVFCNIYLKSRG
jgi:hypothetical protein